MTETKPKRRWFRFSLRTLFVVMMLLCAWLAYQFNWIRARHRVLEKAGESIFVIGGHVPAPWSIRLFERGFREICVDPDVARNAQKVSELKRLFPEATIWTPIDGLPVIRNSQNLSLTQI